MVTDIIFIVGDCLRNMNSTLHPPSHPNQATCLNKNVFTRNYIYREIRTFNLTKGF